MSRFARENRVFFFEEPVYEDREPHLRSSVCAKTGVHVLTPVLPNGLQHAQIVDEQKRLLSGMLDQYEIENYVAWYYTPMAREFAGELRPLATVYDCMDELSSFSGAPSAMRANELELFKEADLVFTGGSSLYESKRKQHPAVYLFPSSVDVAHFARALTIEKEPEDQAHLPQPRLGYAGVIDERMDLDLVAKVAALRPDWQFVLLGPVAKIDDASLPRASNIHYLGMKQYADLPAYFSGWQIGILPFALNESTRFISPTKTPEYLAAGLQVISTAIRDVVTPYGEKRMAGIAGSAEQFVEIADTYLAAKPSPEFRTQVDQFLSQSSWDTTWARMSELIREVANSHVAGTIQLTQKASEGVAHV